jgi:uncharacterized protein YbcI
MTLQQKQSTAISNGIAALHREHYGRGAERVRTVVHADYVVTLMEDPFTPAERLTISKGEFRQVREMRTMFQDWMRVSFSKVVEDATGRPVSGFFSQVSAEPPVSLEFFVLAPVDSPTKDGRVVASETT